MKKPGCTLALVILVLVALSQAQSPDSPSQSEKPGSTPADSTKPDYSKEAFVVERLYNHYRFETDGTGKKIGTLRVHVLSEGGVQAFGQLRFGYNAANDRLDIGYVRVIKSDGNLVTAG